MADGIFLALPKKGGKPLNNWADRGVFRQRGKLLWGYVCGLFNNRVVVLAILVCTVVVLAVYEPKQEISVPFRVFYPGVDRSEFLTKLRDMKLGTREHVMVGKPTPHIRFVKRMNDWRRIPEKFLSGSNYIPAKKKCLWFDDIAEVNNSLWPYNMGFGWGSAFKHLITRFRIESPGVNKLRNADGWRSPGIYQLCGHKNKRSFAAFLNEKRVLSNDIYEYNERTLYGFQGSLVDLIRMERRLPLLVSEASGNAQDDHRTERQPKRRPLKAFGCMLAALILLYCFFQRLYFHPERAWWPFCGTLLSLGLFCYGFHLLLLFVQERP